MAGTPFRLRERLQAAFSLAPPGAPVGMTMTPGAVNDRFPVTVFPQRAPEPAPPGVARPAQVQVATFRHPHKWEEDRFVLLTVGPPPRAAVPRGHMNPWGERANIFRPPHVAYGSLFQAGGEQ